MEPLATFEERRIAGRRHYRLFPNQISLTGREYLGSKYEMTITLGSLDTAVDRMTAREPLFRSGSYMLLGGAVANAVFVHGLKVERFTSMSGLAMTLALVGLIKMLVSWREREWVIFKNLQGQQVANLRAEKRFG